MKIISFNLFENTANNTQGNTKGMSNVKSPQPSKETGKVNELPSETRIPEPIENNSVDSKKEEKTNESVKSFLNFLNEDGGVAAATAGNTSGMGNVTAPIVSAIPGDVAGSTAGSGDIPAYDKGKYFGTKTNRKKKKKSTKESIESFSDWCDNLHESVESESKWWRDLSMSDKKNMLNKH